MVCMLLINFVNYVFLLLCMFSYVYSVSLCCSMYCLYVNVYCTTATRCQPNCSYQIYHIVSRHIISYHIISTLRTNAVERRNGAKDQHIFVQVMRISSCLNRRQIRSEIMTLCKHTHT